MRTIVLGLLVLLVSSFSGAAFAADIPDTHGNRLAAARSYLEVVSMKDMMRDMVAESAKNLPENVRPSYVQYMTKAIRVEVLESTALASMAQHFTVKELKALATFYGSPEGRSAMKKFGAYMADVMPVIQQEMLRAQQQLESQSRQKR
jgi:hypothetical protein